MVRHHIPIIPEPVLVLLLVVIVVILPARTTCTHHPCRTSDRLAMRKEERIVWLFQISGGYAHIFGS
jgi:hypothetical protein